MHKPFCLPLLSFHSWVSLGQREERDHLLSVSDACRGSERESPSSVSESPSSVSESPSSVSESPSSVSEECV